MTEYQNEEMDMDVALLTRYLNGKCSAAEIVEVDRWVAADGRHAEWLFGMERIWALRDGQRFADPQSVDEAFGRLWTRLHRRDGVADARPARRAVPWQTALKYAAAAVIVVLLSVNLFHLTKGAADGGGENVIEVPRGQRIALTLPDATRVWLNSGSTLSYPSRFPAGGRTVKLSGEGFFEVAKSGSRPFTVESSTLNVKVLGTKFDMKTYPHENASVTLAEGAVEVSTVNGKYTVTLAPSQQAVYSETSGLTLRSDADADLARSWTAGELSFHEQTLTAIAVDLERRFDVSIRIDGEGLAEDRFTCRFASGATVEQIMTNLRDTKRMNYRIDGRTIDIIPYESRPVRRTVR